MGKWRVPAYIHSMAKHLVLDQARIDDLDLTDRGDFAELLQRRFSERGLRVEAAVLSLAEEAKAKRPSNITCVVIERQRLGPPSPGLTSLHLR